MFKTQAGFKTACDEGPLDSKFTVVRRAGGTARVTEEEDLRVVMCRRSERGGGVTLWTLPPRI